MSEVITDEQLSDLVSSTKYCLSLGADLWCPSDERLKAVTQLAQAELSRRAAVAGDRQELSKAVVNKIIMDACESDPADPDHPDAILIYKVDLEIIVREAIAAISEQPSADKPDIKTSDLKAEAIRAAIDALKRFEVEARQAGTLSLLPSHEKIAYVEDADRLAKHIAYFEELMRVAG